MNIEEKLNNYVSAYQKILNESMANDTPYDKLIKKLDELFAQYKITDEKARDARLATLSNLVQGVTATSQQIALQFVMDLERLALLDAQTQNEQKKKEILELQIKAQQLSNDQLEKRAPIELAMFEKQKELIEAQILKLQKDTELAKSQQLAIDRQVKDNRIIKGMSVMSDFLQGVQGNGGLVAPAGMNQVLFNMNYALTKDDGIEYPKIDDYGIKKS